MCHRYNIVEMTPWESAVWAIGSIANIMCFILAWVYVFDSIQLELKELDDAQEVRVIWCHIVKRP